MNKEPENIQLYSKVAELIELARKKVASAVNLTMVHTYFEIGRMIVEDEQQGKERAVYGKSVLKGLSKRLTERFGRGFSVENLDKMRFFYKVYSISNSSTLLTKSRNVESQVDSIRQKPSSELQYNENQLTAIQQIPSAQLRDFTLSWSHYLILMRIENPSERSFYEIEALSQNWSERQLKRQYHSSLYERLALSRNKEEVMRLANEGHTVVKPEDILKNPLSLEFLGLEERASFTESDIEHAIIDKLQHFLLEAG